MICSTIHTRVEEDEEEGRPGKEKERERGREGERRLHTDSYTSIST